MRSRDGSFRGRWSRLPLLLGAIALAPGAAGCMTVYTQAAYFEDGQVDVEGWPCGSVYAGTAGDIFLIRGGYCSCSGGPGPGDGALDLPLSLAADTALLPLTIAETIVMARRRRDAGKRDMDTEELRREAEREMEALRRRKEGGDAE